MTTGSRENPAPANGGGPPPSGGTITGRVEVPGTVSVAFCQLKKKKGKKKVTVTKVVNHTYKVRIKG